MTGNQLLGV